MWSYIVKESHIGPVVREILQYRQIKGHKNILMLKFFCCLSVVISLSIALIKFFIAGKLHIGPRMVVFYFHCKVLEWFWTFFFFFDALNELF